MSEYSRYGSNQAKKMYIYGRLDRGETILSPAYRLWLDSCRAGY